ncbi:MAG: hypothetical protein B6D55_06250 [Candidatus Omnitrophica bacterium 4484_70.2]|nr:MAG: hypothetical protein B6D55_06250 [Candidatus Omnitrophica bacterium 4484_70.2]
MLAILFLIIFTIITRIIPHPPNFTPLIAVALFSGVYFKKRFSFLIPLSIYVISDLILGVSDVSLFCWITIVFIYSLGTSSILFFLITNFGVWLMGWYPQNWQGLIQCYIAALPFFRNTLISAILYTAVLFGGYEFLLKFKTQPEPSK